MLLLAAGIPALSKDPDSLKAYPKWKPILKVFANYHATISEHDMPSAFEVERAYLGLGAELGRNFDMKVVLDIGSPDDISEFSRIRRYAYFKNAALTYKTGGLKVHFGLIDMNYFKIMEEAWGHRYIERSFADRFRLGTTADLGIDVIYEFTDFISADLTVSNGEGYTNLQRDHTVKGALGVTANPIKEFTLRVYGDIMNQETSEVTLAAFAGYRFREKAGIGIESHWKINERYEEDHSRWGYSVYASWDFWKDLEIFGRYDWIGSNVLPGDDIPWNLIQDGSSLILGLQYEPVKYVCMSLNYRDWYPYAENLQNLASIYFNVEFRY
jgi:hypothetical protein